MENEHAHEIGMIQQDITKLRANHERMLQSLEADFNIRLVSEYDRYQVCRNPQNCVEYDCLTKDKNLMIQKPLSLSIQLSFPATLTYYS